MHSLVGALTGRIYKVWMHMIIDSFLASGDFCCQLITFANSLDPDQDRQHVGPDLDPNCLTGTLIVFLKGFF